MADEGRKFYDISKQLNAMDKWKYVIKYSVRMYNRCKE